MSKSDNLQDFVRGVGQAIATKKGISGVINAQDFEREILSIQSGDMGENVKEVLDAIGVDTSGNDTQTANNIARASVDEPSEQTFNGERATAGGVSIEDGVAYLKTIKGQSLKVAQAYRHGSNIGSAVQIEGTGFVATAQSININSNLELGYADLVINGHKYLFIADFKSSDITEISVRFNAVRQGVKISAEYKRLAFVVSTDSSRQQALYVYFWYSEHTIGAVTYSRNFQLLDLTAMGMEDVATADEFAQRLGYSSIDELPYIPYTEGEVVGMRANSIVSKGADKSELDTFPLDLSSIKDGDGQPLFPDGLHGIGDVRDEITETQAIKRIGVVDLGDFEYTLEQGGAQMATSRKALLNCAKPTSNTVPNVLCAGYDASSRNAQTGNPSKTIGLSSSGFIKITNVPNTHPDGGAFRESVIGVKLYYELETPIEVTFDPRKAWYKAQNGGTEELVSDGFTAPITAEIGYKGGIAGQALNLL